MRRFIGKNARPRQQAPEDLARRFHEAYERLAPDHGYETREASAVPWTDVPEQNKALMIAVCSEIGTLFRSIAHECCAERDALAARVAELERQRAEGVWAPSSAADPDNRSEPRGIVARAAKIIEGQDTYVSDPLDVALALAAAGLLAADPDNRSSDEKS